MFQVFFFLNKEEPAVNNPLSVYYFWIVEI